jgi:hypothetical protein
VIDMPKNATLEHADELVLVKTTIRWPNGAVSNKVIDLNNKDSAMGMCHVFKSAIAKGCTIIEVAPYKGV